MKLTVAPPTPDRWSDLETIFNAKGCSVARGCWCMAYRLSGSREPLPPGMTRAQANRAGLKALVDAGNPPGLIGYHGKVPVGWVSVGPREEYAKLKRSPVMKAVDEQPVWSVICFVVPAKYRSQGVAQALLKGAVTAEYIYTEEEALRPAEEVTKSMSPSLWVRLLAPLLVRNESRKRFRLIYTNQMSADQRRLAVKKISASTRGHTGMSARRRTLR